MVEKIDKPGVIYAMKRIKKKKLTKQKHFEHVECEREILKITQSPFIVNLHYAFQDKESLFYVGKPYSDLFSVCSLIIFYLVLGSCLIIREFYLQLFIFIIFLPVFKYYKTG